MYLVGFFVVSKIGRKHRTVGSVDEDTKFSLYRSQWQVSVACVILYKVDCLVVPTLLFLSISIQVPGVASCPPTIKNAYPKQ